MGLVLQGGLIVGVVVVDVVVVVVVIAVTTIWSFTEMMYTSLCRVYNVLSPLHPVYTAHLSNRSEAN